MFYGAVGISAGHASDRMGGDRVDAADDQGKKNKTNLLITFRAENDWNVIRFQVAFGFNAHQKWTASSCGHALTWISTALKSQRERTFLKAAQTKRKKRK